MRCLRPGFAGSKLRRSAARRSQRRALQWATLRAQPGRSCRCFDDAVRDNWTGAACHSAFSDTPADCAAECGGSALPRLAAATVCANDGVSGQRVCRLASANTTTGPGLAPERACGTMCARLVSSELLRQFSRCPGNTAGFGRFPAPATTGTSSARTCHHCLPNGSPFRSADAGVPHAPTGTFARRKPPTGQRPCTALRRFVEPPCTALCSAQCTAPSTDGATIWASLQPFQAPPDGRSRGFRAGGPRCSTGSAAGTGPAAACRGPLRLPPALAAKLAGLAPVGKPVFWPFVWAGGAHGHILHRENGLLRGFGPGGRAWFWGTPPAGKRDLFFP